MLKIRHGNVELNASVDVRKTKIVENKLINLVILNVMTHLYRLQLPLTLWWRTPPPPITIKAMSLHLLVIEIFLCHSFLLTIFNWHFIVNFSLGTNNLTRFLSSLLFNFYGLPSIFILQMFPSSAMAFFFFFFSPPDISIISIFCSKLTFIL